MAPRRPAGADAFPKKTVEPFVTRPAEDGPLYAALDLGTNSCRMLIARPLGSQFQVVDSFSKPVQLGHGLEASGRLSRSSMARTVHALRTRVRVIARTGSTRSWDAATAVGSRCRRIR